MNFATLLDSLGGFSESEYLTYLRDNIPAEAKDRIIAEAGTSLGYDDEISREEFVEPITTMSFRRDKLWDINFILEERLAGWDRTWYQDDDTRYVGVLIASFALHARAMDPERSEHDDPVSPTAVAALLAACIKGNDLVLRVHVIRFFLWIIVQGTGFDANDNLPIRLSQVAIATMLGSIGADLLDAIADAKQIWLDEEWETGGPRHKASESVRAVCRETLGPDGKTNQAVKKIRG